MDFDWSEGSVGFTLMFYFYFFFSGTFLDRRLFKYNVQLLCKLQIASRWYFGSSDFSLFSKGSLILRKKFTEKIIKWAANETSIISILINKSVNFKPKHTICNKYQSYFNSDLSSFLNDCWPSVIRILVCYPVPSLKMVLTSYIYYVLLVLVSSSQFFVWPLGNLCLYY